MTFLQESNYLVVLSISIQDILEVHVLTIISSPIGKEAIDLLVIFELLPQELLSMVIFYLSFSLDPLGLGYSYFD